jgi:hypothetical protein
MHRTRPSRALRTVIAEYRKHPDLDHPLYGEDKSSCPYYAGKGICQGGCRTEPSCVTGEPLRGWPSRRRPNRPVDKVRQARLGVPIRAVEVRRAFDRVDQARWTRGRYRSAARVLRCVGS